MNLEQDVRLKVIHKAFEMKDQSPKNADQSIHSWGRCMFDAKHNLALPFVRGDDVRGGLISSMFDKATELK